MTRTGAWGAVPGSQHAVTWLRLRRALRGRARFRLLVLVFGDSSYRDALISELATAPDTQREGIIHESSTGPLPVVVAIRPNGDNADLEERLREAARQAPLLHVVGFEHLGAERDVLLTRLNYARESLAEACPVALLCWMHDSDATAMAQHAPDLWAWRTGVYEFLAASLDSPPLALEPAGLPPRFEVGTGQQAYLDGAAALRRLSEVEEHLREVAPDPTRSQAGRAILGLRIEAGDLAMRLGEPGRAEAHFRSAITSLEDESVALAATLADRGAEKGALGEPWRAGEQVEQTEAARDAVLALAVAKGRIADILVARGQLDEALRIRQEEQLPVYEQLGDVRGLAVAKTNCALTLLKRAADGDREQAGRLLREAIELVRPLKLPEEATIRRILEESGASGPC